MLACIVALSARADEPFSYFRNDWSVIGLKDYERGARVTPDGRLMLEETVVRFRYGRDLVPLDRRNVKTLEEGWLPIVRIPATDGDVRYELELWATPLPNVPDWQRAFDWPVAGENFLCWVRLSATNTGREPAAMRWSASSTRAEATCAIDRTLAPAEVMKTTLRVPFQPGADPAAFAGADPDLWHARTARAWKRALEGAAEIEVPCEKATQALLAAHVCQLIANDHGDVHGGEGFYDQFYIRDGAYQVLELEEAGLWDAAERAVALYLPRQRDDGRFESQEGQLDANGQALWVLWQYWRMTADRAWLEAVYPRMRRAVDWLMKARREAPADSAFAGLLPAAPADGEYLWDGEHHIVGYDLWNLRGLLCTADAAATLGKEAEATALREEAARYREAIDAAWARTGLAYFPPSWELAGTHWGNTETLWPTELFERDDPRVVALGRHVRDDWLGGFREGTIRWKGHREAIHPYMGQYTVMTELVRGEDETVVEDFFWYLLHSTATHAFPEGIYAETREAWGDTIPHVTGACNYAILLRHMLVHEERGELHLLKAAPDGWLREGQRIRIRRAPTYFGSLDLDVVGEVDGVRVTLRGPDRERPARVVLHLPESIAIAEVPKGVEILRRADQRVDWDFGEAVRRYEAMDPPPAWLPPDAPSLTTNRPVTCSSALTGFPPELANDGFAGDTDAYWATDVERLSDPAPWWRVDLEEPTTVGRVIVVAYYGDERAYGFSVETSLDGEAWELVADRRGASEPSKRTGYTCRFEPRPVRYLRVTEHENSANTGRHLVEVMAYDR